ncbi:MAG TPA: intradiol ring-cleavage dioxygenase [Croceibacterium sp.]|nr:intradiol ring-cleavage dioxygenase [Croceibacterium sp.]
MTTTSSNSPASHGHGLLEDIERIDHLRLGRRRALAWLGSVGGGALLAGCGGGGSPSSSSSGSGSGTVTPTPTPSSSATPTPSPGSTAACTVPASETNGPYPGDGTNSSAGITSNALTSLGVVRSDIRSSFVGSSTTVATGVETRLTLTLVDANNGCTPLQGYAVYIWQCDKDGAYSLYNLPTESYLRGVQVTDANGQVTFTTVFPGCYSGRWPHIHFEVFSSQTNATSGRYAVLISQFAMPQAQCAEVYATSAYQASVSAYNRVSLASDGIFADNTAAQMAVMTLTMAGSVTDGYTATSTIGIAT